MIKLEDGNHRYRTMRLKQKLISFDTLAIRAYPSTPSAAAYRDSQSDVGEQPGLSRLCWFSTAPSLEAPLRRLDSLVGPFPVDI